MKFVAIAPFPNSQVVDGVPDLTAIERVQKTVKEEVGRTFDAYFGEKR